eukprot:scaffold11812_cov134-Isochrysis_galbana.AAC.1
MIHENACAFVFQTTDDPNLTAQSRDRAPSAGSIGASRSPCCSDAAASSAALCPVSMAPWMHGLIPSWHASPQKKRRPPTGAESCPRAPSAEGVGYE